MVVFVVGIGVVLVFVAVLVDDYDDEDDDEDDDSDVENVYFDVVKEAEVVVDVDDVHVFVYQCIPTS